MPSREKVEAETRPEVIIMGYKRIAILFFSLVLMLGVGVMTASAQRHYYRVYRPVVRTHFGFGYGWHDPFWSSYYYDPYYYDPYYREQVDRYNHQKDVADARRKLAKDREKYGSDGYVDAKEQEKLMKDQQKYREKVEKLNKFDREH